MVTFDLAREMLAEAETLLAPSVTGRQLPARRYVAHGQPVVEGPDGLLAVTVTGLDLRQPDRNTEITMRVAGLAVEVWRCWPTGDSDIPDPVALQEAAEGLADDCDRLLLGLPEWLATRCHSVEWRPVSPLGPTGGLAGWRIEVAVSV